MRRDKMKRVGITGGIGCGKSTVVREFEKRGVAAFVADSVAAGYYHEPQFLEALREHFGEGVFCQGGEVDKRRLAQRVFADKEELLRLNALVHPRVMSDFERFCEEHASEAYVLFESAILYDYGFAQRMDRVVCVYLDREERIRRLMERDRVSLSEIEARMRSQMEAEEMMRRADYVVLNYEGNPRQRQVALIDKYLRR